MTRFLSILLTALLITFSCAGAAADKKDVITDGWIEDHVRLKLVNDPDVRGGAFEVAVKDGVVTIKGKVEKEKFRQKAEKLVKKVKGVKQVVNQVQVAPR
jgi:osmotically-inducible protein OsmY